MRERRIGVVVLAAVILFGASGVAGLAQRPRPGTSDAGMVEDARVVLGVLGQGADMPAAEEGVPGGQQPAVMIRPDDHAAVAEGSNIASQCAECSSITWVPRASMPTARCGVGTATTVDGTIYAIGAHISNSTTTLRTVEQYDPSTNTWQTRSNMPTPRGYLGVAVASNGKIYAMGGWNGTSAVAAVEEYDPVADTWRVCASMPTPREGLRVAAAGNGRLYAIGGRNRSGIVATVEE